MKKILIAGSAMFLALILNAQQKEGKVMYERVSQLQIQINDDNPAIQNMLPKSRTDNFELTFGNNQSLWRQAEKENEDEPSEGGGMQIKMFVAGSNDVLYNDFTSGKRTELREMFDKKFIIDDSIRPGKWKMTGESKMILNHNCMKATTSQTRTSMRMNMDNGKMERKEVTDTLNIVAWFATDIPVAAGPAEYQGQLPGLILEMDISNGRQTYRATNISPKADLAQIKEPAGKKHYTPDEFAKERNKMMEQMQQNMGGPGRTIRIAQ